MRSLLLTSALLLGAIFAGAQTVPPTQQTAPPNSQIPGEPGTPVPGEPPTTPPTFPRTQLPKEQPQAQKPEEPAPANSGEQQNPKQLTIEGCLNGSNGTFIVTDESRGPFELLGAKRQLSRNVGHTVQVTGIASNATAGQTQSPAVSANSQQEENETTPPTNPTADSGQQTLRVSKVKVISNTCNDVPQR